MVAGIECKDWPGTAGLQQCVGMGKRQQGLQAAPDTPHAKQPHLPSPAHRQAPAFRLRGSASLARRAPTRAPRSTGLQVGSGFEWTIEATPDRTVICSPTNRQCPAHPTIANTLPVSRLITANSPNRGPAVGRARSHCRASSHSSAAQTTARAPAGSAPAHAQLAWYRAAAVSSMAAVDSRYSATNTRREGTCAGTRGQNRTQLCLETEASDGVRSTIHQRARYKAAIQPSQAKPSRTPQSPLTWLSNAARLPGRSSARKPWGSRRRRRRYKRSLRALAPTSAAVSPRACSGAGRRRCVGRPDW